MSSQKFEVTKLLRNVVVVVVVVVALYVTIGRVRNMTQI